MVRAVTYILLAFTLLCSCSSSVKDIQRYQLHGNVECIEIWECEDSTSLQGAQNNVNTSLRGRERSASKPVASCSEAACGCRNGTSATWQSTHFNTNGMLDSIITYSPQDTLRHIYVYNSKGLLSEIRILHTDGKYEALYEYEYKGKTISSYAFRGVDMQVLYRWDYDIKDDKQTGCRCYNEGVLINRSEFTYDGLNKTETVYSPDDEPWGTTTYTYAAPATISSISGDGFEIIVEYGEDRLPSKSINGIIGPDGEIFTNADSRHYGTIHYEYVLDDKGNWIERLELLGDEKAKGKTIRRKIIYR